MRKLLCALPGHVGSRLLINMSSLAPSHLYDAGLEHSFCFGWVPLTMKIPTLHTFDPFYSLRLFSKVKQS